MYDRVYLLILAALLAISGCSSDGNERREEYLDADYYTRLELPPDLTAPEDSKQLVSPQPTPEAIEQYERDSAEIGKVDTEVAPVPIGIKVQGARIKTGDGVFWLEIDENSNKLWPQLSAFWSHEGIQIVRNEPMLGMVETDWVSKLQLEEDAGFFRTMFSKIDPSKLDKFRMRVEPEEVPDKTRIFMSHSGIEMVVEGDDSNWRSRCSEEELEREMLTRLALYVGLDRQQAAAAFANYRPYASRVRVPQDSMNTLYVTGTEDFVWKRSLRALDRMGVAMLEMDAGNHQIKVALEKLTDEQLGLEKDELAESSWLMQWLSGAPGEGYKNDLDRQFIIKLTRRDGIVRLDILKPDNEPAESVLAEQFRKTLALELQ